MCTALASATHWTHLNRIIVDVCTMTSPGFDRALTKKSAVAFLLNDWWPYITTTTFHYLHTNGRVCASSPGHWITGNQWPRPHYKIDNATADKQHSICNYSDSTFANIGQLIITITLNTSPVPVSVRSSYVHHDVIFSNMCGNAAYWFSIPWRIIYFYALSYVFQLNFIGFTGIDLLM